MSAQSQQPRDLDYAQLRRLVRESGLLDRQPLYYWVTGVVTVAAFIGGFITLLFVQSLVLQMLDAVWVGVVLVQIGFLAHDAGHRQITSRASSNDMLGLLFTNALQGGSYGWWKDKHNRHHGSPNNVDEDPDVDMRVLSYSEEQALARRGTLALLARYQAYLFFPMLTMAHINMRVTSVRHLFARRSWSNARELALIAAHVLTYFGLLIGLIGVWRALLFFAINEAVAGVYMGATFAPNHKGMPLISDDNRLGFLREQVLTSRNVRGGPVIDLVFGALCSQIEHHLFPNMPRNNLRRAEPLVKDFCRAHGVSYYEASVLGCYGEILGHLHAVGAPLRNRAVRAPS